MFVHPLYYVFAFLSVLTGHFKAFSFLTMLILIHEFGHIIMGVLFHWKIKRIVILPFGGMTEFNELLNTPIYQEFFILTMGPIFQIVFSFIVPNPYHMPLLLFNLLPIVPLDGSKLVFLFWNKIGTYYNSYKVLFVFSYISIFILLHFVRNLLFVIFASFLLWKSIIMINNLPLIFEIFLFERYKYYFSFKKKKRINKCRQMKRDYEHLIYKDGNYLEEKTFLAKLFDK